MDKAQKQQDDFASYAVGQMWGVLKVLTWCGMKPETAITSVIRLLAHVMVNTFPDRAIRQTVRNELHELIEIHERRLDQQIADRRTQKQGGIKS